MKACLICPIPDLERFVDRQATHHLLLAELFKYPKYTSFYRRRSELGDYLIIDNGAKEYGVGQSLNVLLRHCVAVGADEVVLSDVRYRFAETVTRGRKELEWLQSTAGRVLYNLVGRPRLMIVPQGETPNEWRLCLEQLLFYHDQALLEQRPVVAVAYHYEHLFQGGLRSLLKIPPVLDHDVHLLGWPRALTPIQGLHEEFPNIRSIDSSRPFAYGKSGESVRKGRHDFEHNAYPGRGDNFFTESIPKERESIVRENIAAFREWTGDVLEPAGVDAR